VVDLDAELFDVVRRVVLPAALGATFVDVPLRDAIAARENAMMCSARASSEAASYSCSGMIIMTPGRQW
jgi:hypothetical protein